MTLSPELMKAVERFATKYAEGDWPRTLKDDSPVEPMFVRDMRGFQIQDAKSGAQPFAELLGKALTCLQRAVEYGHELDCSSREARWVTKGDACDCRLVEAKEALASIGAKLKELGE